MFIFNIFSIIRCETEQGTPVRSRADVGHLLDIYKRWMEGWNSDDRACTAAPEWSILPMLFCGVYTNCVPLSIVRNSRTLKYLEDPKTS